MFRMQRKWCSGMALVCGLGLALTAQGAGSAPWKFAVLCDSRGGDNGVDTATLGAIADQIAAADVDLVIFPGDLVDSGNASAFATWRATMAPVYNADIPVYPVRGNHEGSSGWIESFGDDIPDNGPSGQVNYSYSVEHENALFIGFEHYIATATHGWIPNEWIRDLLAANTKPHIFTFGHEPCFKVDHTDCLDDDPAERDEFVEDLLEGGGKLYFCGHDHFLDILRADDDDGDITNDFIQYLVGTAGAPLYTAGAYDGNNSYFAPTNIEYNREEGYTIVEVDGGDVTLTHYNTSGIPVHVMAYSVIVDADPAIIPSTNFPIADLPFTLTAPEGSNYQWSHEGTPLGNEATLDLSPLDANAGGSYWVTYQDTGGGKAEVTLYYVLTVLPASSVVPTVSLVGLGLLIAVGLVGGKFRSRKK